MLIFCGCRGKISIIVFSLELHNIFFTLDKHKKVNKEVQLSHNFFKVTNFRLIGKL